jgi:hypothetical protein
MDGKSDGVASDRTPQAHIWPSRYPEDGIEPGGDCGPRDLLPHRGRLFTVWTFVEVLRQPEGAKSQSGGKPAWVVVILLTGILGATIYQLAGKPTVVVRDTPPKKGLRPPDQDRDLRDRCDPRTLVLAT